MIFDESPRTHLFFAEGADGGSHRAQNGARGTEVDYWAISLGNE